MQCIDTIFRTVKAVDEGLRMRVKKPRCAYFDTVHSAVVHNDRKRDLLDEARQGLMLANVPRVIHWPIQSKNSILRTLISFCHGTYFMLPAWFLYLFFYDARNSFRTF